MIREAEEAAEKIKDKAEDAIDEAINGTEEEQKAAADEAALDELYEEEGAPVQSFDESTGVTDSSDEEAEV